MVDCLFGFRTEEYRRRHNTKELIIVHSRKRMIGFVAKALPFEKLTNTPFATTVLMSAPFHDYSYVDERKLLNLKCLEKSSRGFQALQLNSWGGYFLISHHY
ncbi:hypothetical protein Bca4012_009326 [Brassica carinata]|uniref:Uncharacterized protein n=1 Tax=Brassica carinata TaxID=52824 RepID=A0A8X7V3B8_BRACI|nr:hypothetical protein Bca52824_034588 [Brassica carinata]